MKGLSFGLTCVPTEHPVKKKGVLGECDFS